ncbi:MULTISPECIES: ABC transporter permease [unclassified Rhodococcus (in: high G+C Gram-positive bacteria)]|uniref:ABC transporter permease n=1 Tax=unclassified Rhodococcus (in: high G+C Gram-positive bacteria) TaxID=192944 RepID=UPI0011EC3D71|nr:MULTISPECIES: ABC transporter permease [unclassified Rhodococcus (in: high G+C Gram-positive bacteria)]KAA0924034.1 ABC transporter [Rhodococcus sp. ANT_H53B]MDI9926667.1 ABC transporter permease [Rhodococcus sp. IEGM 1341]
MNAFSAEMIKLRRSQAWAVVVPLPLIIAGVGTFNTIASGAELTEGWRTLWLRTVVFYGLFPLALGVAALASLVWRSEHRGGNWNALMSGPVPSVRIVIVKTAVVATLTAAMNIVMLAAVVVLGKVVFSLDGTLPSELFATGALIVVGSLPVAALHSALSMAVRSFAVPIAIALVGAGISVFLLTAEVTGAILSPYALATRATQLTSGTFGDSGSPTTGAALSVLTATALLTVAVVASAGRALDRKDIHVQ